MSSCFARLLAGIALALASAIPCGAQTPEQFYAGKSVSIVVPTSPGGNFDLNARMVSRHLGRFIPGQPTVLVRNMPGAGGMLLANQFVHTREQDGLTIAIMERGTPQLAYEGNPNVKFDPLKFNWIGSLSSYANDAYLMLVNDSHPAKTIADLRKPEMVVRLGGDMPGSTNLTFAVLARDLLKLNVKLIRGYPGAAPMFIAMQGGELDGQMIGLGSVRGAQPALWNGKKVRPLLQAGRTSRLAELSDIPIAREFRPHLYGCIDGAGRIGFRHVKCLLGGADELACRIRICCEPAHICGYAPLQSRYAEISVIKAEELCALRLHCRDLKIVDARNCVGAALQ